MQEKHMAWLAMSKEELQMQGVQQPDFVLITGDAYVDHPSFGAAVIGRVLQAAGFHVGVIAQPNWKSPEAFCTFGRPRLAFLVTAGNLDSMVNHYTVTKRRRKTDVYAPDGQPGLRPDRATIVYTNRCKEAYRGCPVIIGGLEASLRRLAHYDYWADAVRHSILIDSGADILLYGMAETAIKAVAEALRAGTPLQELRSIPGTAYTVSSLEEAGAHVLLPSYMEVEADKHAYAHAFMQQYKEQDAIRGRRLVQAHEKGFVVVNPPAMPLDMAAMDAVYDLPYTRLPHPAYHKKHIPALDEVAFSLTSCRGCFGACSFCALTFHQGRVVQARSHRSLINEAKQLINMPGFKGYIHDVGGPTANFRKPACAQQLSSGTCKDKQCIGYVRCDKLRVDHSDYVQLLNKLSALAGVKKVFIRSGVRYDYVMYDKDNAFMKALTRNHVSGRLKVAPEHVDEHVLYYMNKPSEELYERFVQRYTSMSRDLGIEQYIEPYFISSHPGSDLNAAIALAQFIQKSGQRPEQVQDFYPTPGTLSTCMYHTGLDPRTMQPLYVARSQHEKGLQRALMQYYLPQNREKVREALLTAQRDDLIGYGKHALVLPQREEPPAGTYKKQKEGLPKKGRQTAAKPAKQKHAAAAPPAKRKKRYRTK